MPGTHHEASCYLMPTTIESGPARCSTRVWRKPAFAVPAAEKGSAFRRCSLPHVERTTHQPAGVTSATGTDPVLQEGDVPGGCLAGI